MLDYDQTFKNLEHLVKSGKNILTPSTREKAIELLEDRYISFITGLDDEGLIKEITAQGII